MTDHVFVMFASGLIAACPAIAAGANAGSSTGPHKPDIIDLREAASVDYSFSPAALDQPSPDQKGEPADNDRLSRGAFEENEQPAPFGAADSTRLHIHGAFARDTRIRGNQFGLLGGGLSRFIIDNLSMDAEINALYLDQVGPSAWASNVNLLSRWHFVAEETWSLYFDGGAGVFYASRRVPHDGSRFNFTPQAGSGITVEIAPDMRMMLGVRWHHISNANTSRHNPGQDSVMGYAGLSLPF